MLRHRIFFAGYLLLALSLIGCRKKEVPSPIAAVVSVPALTSDQRLKLIQHQPIYAESSIFDGDGFPKIDFLNKELVTAAVGPYTISTRFFDEAWNEVAAPTTPGRYGAWVESRLADGTIDHRGITLFKMPGHYMPSKDPYRVTIDYPAAFGFSDDLMRHERSNVDASVTGMVTGESHHGDDGARLAAALHDIAADPKRWHGFDSRTIDGEWWATLKDKLGVSHDYQRLVRLPDDYDQKPAAQWPLILFLHGSGERGNDLNKLNNQGPIGYLNQVSGRTLPFILVSPQCPEGEGWASERLFRLIDDLEKTYRIDPKRIYVTGLSLGGFGTLHLAASDPTRFAAIASLSGGASPGLADRLRNVPTWLFHGDADNVVPPQYSIGLARAMKRLGAPVKLTLYPGLGHGGWDKTYADPALYAWFLSHSR